jgi:hypothetical protein
VATDGTSTGTAAPPTRSTGRRLQRELIRSLGVEWTEADRHGNRELRGIHKELLRAFSKRTEQVNAEVERLAASGRVRTPRLV